MMAPINWLSWRVLLCALWISLGMVFAALLIWRYEGNRKSTNRPSEDQNDAVECLYEDEVWGTCSKSIHPIWLLAYRIVAFCALLGLLLADISSHGGGKFYFYTEWTFTLVAVYFGVPFLELLLCTSPFLYLTLTELITYLGSSLSILGCLHYYRQVEPEMTDSDRGSYVPLSLEENADLPSQTDRLNHYGDPNCRTVASVWGYALQIVFQMCAGAVVLTDSVFWLIIYPFLTPKYYRLSLLVICKHSVNAALFGDAILNCLRFPFFRIAYFIIWTCTFVIFQWIIHACVSIRWPYPFMDLSSPYAPLWYFAIGLFLFPCFGIFSLIFKIKQCCLSR